MKGTVIVSCMPDKPDVSLISNFYSSSTVTDLQAYMLGYFVSTNDVNSFKDQQRGRRSASSTTYSRYTDLTTDETDALTEQIFSSFILDITNHKGIPYALYIVLINFIDTVNSTANPIDGTIIDTNRVTSIGNVFTNNYALHSHLFIQGAYNTLVKNTTFEDNSIPVPQFIGTSLTQSNILFEKALNNATYWTVTENTPLMLRMSNYITITDCEFTNNTQLLLDASSLAFGSAITIDKHLGIIDVSITDTKFGDNQGWTYSGLYDLVKSTTSDSTLLASLKSSLESGVFGAMITYNYWDYMYGVAFYDASNVPQSARGFYDYQAYTPTLTLDSCTFYNNTFNIPESNAVGESKTWTSGYRTAFVRRYDAQEGISSSTAITSGTYINEYGGLVLYANIVFNDCLFSTNTVSDQRSFLSPYGFKSLTLKNSVFRENTIEDINIGEYYSIRAYLYSYLDSSDLTNLIVKNVTFNANTGKIAYLQDSSSLDQSLSSTVYKITLEDITVEDHISSPDFLFHLVQKQYTTISSITATNIAGVMGFMFLDTPRVGFTADSITIQSLISTQVGCLYATSLESSVSLAIAFTVKM